MWGQVWDEIINAFKSVVTDKPRIHLACRELPGEGIQAACGALSRDLPLTHSFTSDASETSAVDCGPCRLWARMAACAGDTP